MTTEANDPINPVGNAHYSDFHGLTKREYFAAMAMHGILANPESKRSLVKNVVESSVLCADKLIEELNK